MSQESPEILGRVGSQPIKVKPRMTDLKLANLNENWLIASTLINELEVEIGKPLIKGNKDGVISKEIAIKMLQMIELHKRLYLNNAYPELPPHLRNYKSPFLRVNGKFCHFDDNGLSELGLED